MIKEVLQQLEPLDAQIDALCSRADDAEMASTTTHAAELAELSAEENTLLQRCTSLTPEDRVFLARRPDRPHITEMIDNLFTDFFEQCGDRQCKEDAAILCGIARFHGMPVTVLGHRKGTTLEENLRCNFGMPGPEGYRKALRVMKQAEKFQRPIITFIDTPGAYPGKDAEERGQGEAIARNLMEMSGLTVPVLAIVTGEGSSGGALGLGVANHILMLENAVYSVLSPEGFASILWKDASRSGEACTMMKLTAQDLYADGIVEEVIPEPLGGAQRGRQLLFSRLDTAIAVHLAALCKMSGKALADQRYKKYRRIGDMRGGYRRGIARPCSDERGLAPTGGHQRRMDHDPHRHLPALLLHRKRGCRHAGYHRRPSGPDPQRSGGKRHCLLCCGNALGPDGYPKHCLPRTGCFGSAGKPACL